VAKGLYNTQVMVQNAGGKVPVDFIIALLDPVSYVQTIRTI
jgi:hypothetical protein